MWRNRIILLILIIGSGVFASFFGGPLPYALLFLTLFTPLASLLYLVYVYYRFCLYQYLDKKTLVKYESVPFRFVLANEDFLSYSHIEVSFLSDFSTLEKIDASDCHTLLPNEREEYETSLSCQYSGIYQVGIDRIYLEDPFCLFRLAYSCPSPMEVHVLPRILQPERLPFLDLLSEGLALTDNQSSPYPDAETRAYQPGDSKKRIHWKALAHHGKLVTRKILPEPKPELHLFLDLDLPFQDLSAYLPRFDLLSETTLAIVNFCMQKKLPCNVYGDCQGYQHFPVNTQQEFEALYAFFCQNERLRGNSLTTLLSSLPREDITNSRCIFLSTKPDIELYRALEGLQNAGNTIVVLCLCSQGFEELMKFSTERFVVLPIDPKKDLLNSLERN